MRQAISACQLLEETENAPQLAPRSIWGLVQAKDKGAILAARGWGSLTGLWLMAPNAESDEELLVSALAVPAIVFCQRCAHKTRLLAQIPYPPPL